MTSLKVDRRSFIKGLGAATGLASSFFGSNIALGATDKAPLRVILVALTHGWGRDLDLDRKFTGSEFDFTIPHPLKSLDAIKDECVFVDGVRGTLWGNAHDVSYSDIFTAATVWGEGDSKQIGAHFPEPMGPSLDYVLGQHSKKPVLRVSANYRSWGRKSNPICYDDKFQVIDSFYRPIDAYDAIIGPIKGSAAPPMPGRDAIRNNLFQYLGRDTDRLLKKVNGSERLKLESYLKAVNDLGDRILQQSKVVISEEDIPGRPEQSPAFSNSVDNYIDMIRLVFQADTHRHAVLSFGQGIDSWSWRDKDGKVQDGNPWGTNFHHEVAHHGSKNTHAADARTAFEGWVDWYVKKIVKLANTLKATPDVDGKSLLDNTLIMLTGEVGTGNHDTRNKLHTLIGGGDRLERGRWINVPTVDPRKRDGVFIGGQKRDGGEEVSGLNYGRGLSVMHTADVLTAIGQLAGLNITSFGLPANNKAPMKLDLRK